MKATVLKPINSPKDIINYTGWGQTTVYNLFNREDFPYFNVGRRKFITEDAFNQWLVEQSETGGVV